LYKGIGLFTAYLVPLRVGYAELAPPNTFSFATAIGIRFFISDLLGELIYIVFINMAPFCFLFIMRVLFRNQKVAVAACILIIALLNWNLIWLSFATGSLILGPLWFFILMRFGLLAEVIAGIMVGLFSTFATTLDDSAWYAGTGYAALAVLAAIVIYAFRTSPGGRPILTPSHLDD